MCCVRGFLHPKKAFNAPTFCRFEVFSPLSSCAVFIILSHLTSNFSRAGSGRRVAAGICFSRSVHDSENRFSGLNMHPRNRCQSPKLFGQAKRPQESQHELGPRTAPILRLETKRSDLAALEIIGKISEADMAWKAEQMDRAFDLHEAAAAWHGSKKAGKRCAPEAAGDSPANRT
jgi:hypothetical protein